MKKIKAFVAVAILILGASSASKAQTVVSAQSMAEIGQPSYMQIFEIEVLGNIHQYGSTLGVSYSYLTFNHNGAYNSYSYSNSVYYSTTLGNGNDLYLATVDLRNIDPTAANDFFFGLVPFNITDIGIVH